MKTTVWMVAVLVLLAGFGMAVAEPTYIGAAKCKMCHKTEHASWLETPHAKAFENLKGDEQSNPECLKCHATGASAEFPGVQCEACHGPGSDYKSMKVMKDHEAAVAAGLLVPDESTCTGCHVGAPHEVPEFNYEEAKKTGLHAVKAE